VNRRSRRYHRTLFISLAALGVMIWFAVRDFGIPWADMRELFYLTLAVIGTAIVAAALVAGGWIVLRKLLHRRD